MRALSRLRMFLLSLFHRRAAESDLDDEMQYHLEQEIAHNISAGMTPEEARFAAQRLIGPIPLYKEECRDARSAGMLESYARDLRYAFRMLRRAPLFTSIAIATLALGIGANTTVFTFVENILLRPLPVRDPQQLAVLNRGEAVNISYPDYRDYRDRNRSFSALIAYRYNPANISLRPRDNVRVWGYEASGNYFDTLGIAPKLGRFFGPSEDSKPGANPVVVISEHFWRTQMLADPNVIGRTVKINGAPFTVIGVAPASFRGTEVIVAADYWVPISMEAAIEPGNNWLEARLSTMVWVMGRLKPGVSRAQAELDLDRLLQQLARTYPDLVDAKVGFQLTPPGLVGGALRRPVTGFGVVLMAIAGAALLLACINLAGMLLARASDRQHEMGIRLAVGASRLQLLHQLMTESLLLAVAGGALGFGIAYLACDLFSSWRPSFDIPFDSAIHPDLAVLCFTALLSVATILFFGLTPALDALKTNVVSNLKNEPASPRLRRWSVRDLIVAGQIALSVVLVICSALVIRSLQRALTINFGFNPNGAVSVSFDLRTQGYNNPQSRRFDETLLRNVAALPGLASVGIVSNMPLRMGEDNEIISRADRPVPEPAQRRAASTYNISPGYFKAAGTRLLAGRDVSAHDRDGSPRVAVVNQALAELLFGHENPLGKHVRMSLDNADKGVEVVGVVETGKYEYIGEDPHPALFLPIEQTGTAWTTVVARTSLSPPAATEMLRKAVLDLDPDLTIFNAGSLKDELALPLFPARVAAVVLGIFGALAMVLAGTGLFALMAYAVSRRTYEIGIRMALGAKPAQVLETIFRRTAILCIVGISVGTVMTLIAGRLLSAVLYGVSPRDPATYAVALLIMVAVGVLASWHPAARAMHVQPARTLREQ